jgi:legumain
VVNNRCNCGDNVGILSIAVSISCFVKEKALSVFSFEAADGGEVMSSIRGVLLAILFASLFGVAAGPQVGIWEGKIVMPSATDEDQGSESAAGVRWAVLLAGSAGYGNYRHQVVFALPATPIQEYLKLLLSEFCFFKSWYPLFFI